jgi:plastocyanin domain-containing protein
MRKLAIFGAVIVLVVFGIVAAANTGSGATGNVIIDNSQVQEVELSFENYEYILKPSKLKAGVPVKMTADMDTVYGCMRDIRIPAFGVIKYVSEEDNVIEFTPTKSGTFNIMCSMNMGRGQFEVVEKDGTKSDFVETTPLVESFGTCGGGSCGCGAK